MFSLYFSIVNRNFKIISLTFILTLSVLVGFFVQNMRYLYRYEKQRVADEVDMTVKQVSQEVLHKNVTLLNNMATMLTDKDFDQKMAFAAGFTQNMASIGVYFDDVEDTAAKTDDVLKVNKEFMRKQNIKQDARHVKGVSYFDSALNAELQARRLPLAYAIRPYLRQDTAVPPDSMASRAFIIDAIRPKIYRIVYATPHTFIRQRLIPNVAGACAVILFVILGYGAYRRSYRTQVQMSRLKESLFGNVTHELKTPVASLQLILDAAVPDDKDNNVVKMSAQHIGYAHTELNRMKYNIDRILSFNKLTGKEFETDKVPVALNAVIRGAISIMHISLEQTGGRVDYTPGEELRVMGDYTLLVNVMTILIDNAIKYTTHTPVITITADRVGKSAVIGVTDNGIGIATWHQKKIFEPFYRIPTGNRHDVKGHGLGLSFAKQVLTMHKGMISVSSPGKDKGATFIINIPLV